MENIIYNYTDDGRLLPTTPPKVNAQDFIPFLTTYLAEWEGCPQRLFMNVCEDYYRNITDVVKKRRMVIGKDENNNPILKESKVLANNKLSHNFLQKLVKQKLGYVISKPFTIDLDDADDEKSKQMLEAIKDYCNRRFFKTVKNCSRDALVDGIGWLQIYYDTQGNLNFKRIPTKEITPIWKDIDHLELEGIIRKYVTVDFTRGKKIEETFVEYYTENNVYYYKYNNGNLMVNDTIYPYGVGSQYLGLIKDKNKPDTKIPIGLSWGKVPFIPFKYNPEELPLLSKIKTLIDDYDNKTSYISDLIEDLPNSITVIKNYDGTSKEEFVQNKNEYRTIFVSGDGDAKALETPLNIVELDKHLQRLREDIYEFGQGVNTADKDIRDTSGVALRFMYADLDMDCNDWTPELETAIMGILDFIFVDIKNKTGIDYSDVRYSILFNTDIIVNETETITNCFTSKGVISDETIAANHPWTRNVDKEMENMRQDDEEELQLEQKYGNTPDNTLKNQIRSSGQE